MTNPTKDNDEQINVGAYDAAKLLQAANSRCPASAGYLWESPDGKYALRRSKDGILWADRYGEPWRNLVGDNLIAAMLYTIEDLSSDNSEEAN